MNEKKFLLIKRVKFHLNKAQFIPETLLSIFIFLLVFLAFYNLIIAYNRNLKSSTDRIIANFLAQEGLELVRGIRNYNYAYKLTNYQPGETINISEWLEGLVNDPNATTVKICLNYDYTTSSCNDLNEASLYLKDGFFTHNSSTSSTSTKFKRLIIITTENLHNNEPIINATSVLVKSQVKWENNVIELNSLIFNLLKF
jgi:hypothetical protein